MGWLTVRGSELNGLNVSWNYMVATCMRDAAVLPYSFAGQAPGLGAVVLLHTGTDATDYWWNTAQTSQIHPNTLGGGQGGRLQLSDWFELPQGGGFKWDRAQNTFTTGNVTSAAWFMRLALVRYSNNSISEIYQKPFAITSDNPSRTVANGSYTNGFDNGETGSIGVSVAIGQGSPALNFATTPLAIDLSFSLPEAAFGNGCKANFDFRNLVCAAAIQHSLVDYKHRWSEKTATGRPMVVNIRSGSLAAANPNSGNADPILATYNLYSENFTIPDKYGAYNTTTTQSSTGLADGTAGYAEIIGSYPTTGSAPRLLVPVGTTNLDNQITLVSLDVVTGSPVVMSHCGFRFTLGT